MATLVFFLVLAAFVAIPVGLVRPKLILRKDHNPTRAKAAAASITMFTLLLVVWVSILPDPKPAGPPPASVATQDKPAKVAEEVAATPVGAVEPLPPGMEDKIISMSNAGLVASMRNNAPRLSKVAEEKRGVVVVETYVSGPSNVRLTLETLPGHGLLPQNPALVRATMERPLADKPSPYDEGMAKTLDAFVLYSAPSWPMADAKAFVGECLMTLTTSGCDRTVKGVRVTAKRYGTDAFKVEAYKP